MKKLLFLLLTVIFVYLIYNISVRKTNYLLINDLNDLSEYIESSKNKIVSVNSDTINRVHHSIINNDTIGNSYFKKILRESDIIIINIGMKEIGTFFLNNDINKNYINFSKLVFDIKLLISEIRKYNYSKIIFVGYYNPIKYYDSKIDSLFYNLELELNNLLKEKDIIYIPMYETVKSNNYKIYNTIYLNDLGKRYISKIIDNIYIKNT